LPTYRNIHLIYNPSAGKLQRANGRFIPRIQEVLLAHGHHVKLTPTAAPGDATRLARRAADGDADLVLVAGGDGTINEALNGVVRSPTPLGIIPLGTGNVLGTELGLTGGPEKVTAELSEWEAERISVGRLEAAATKPRYFLLMAGVGLDAQIVVTVDPQLKKKLGKLAYWLGGLGQLGRHFPEFLVSAAGESWPSSFTLVSRVRNYGGDIEIARNACLLDDYFEMVAFQGKESFRYLKYFTGVLANLLDRMEGVVIRKVRRLEFTTLGPDDIFVQVDGEPAGHLPATVEIVPDALTLLMPAAFRRRFAPGQENDRLA